MTNAVMGINLATQSVQMKGPIQVVEGSQPLNEMESLTRLSRQDVANLKFQDALQGNVVFSDPLSMQNAKNHGRVTPMDKVLNTVQTVQDKFAEIEAHVNDFISKGDIKTADLFMLQYDIMQLSYINELSSKTADKTSNGIQTLFRNQG